MCIRDRWRATYSIAADRPSEYCVWTNAHALARYAALCQEAGLVPIVEPEVLQDGTHSLEQSAKATGRVLQAVYTELHDQRIDYGGTLLKPNMVLSLSLIHISEPTRLLSISYAVFCLKKKK